VREHGCVHTPKSGVRKGQQCCDPLADPESFFCTRHQGGALGFDYGFLNLKAVRSSVMQSDADLPVEAAWQKEVPYDTRQLAIKELLAAYSSQLALKKRGYTRRVFVGFRCKKDPAQSFNIDKDALDLEHLCIFPRRLQNKKKLRARKRDRKKLRAVCDRGALCDSKIIKTADGKWYLCVVQKVLRAAPVPPAFNAVFLDPGVRTFQTFYSPDGVCGKFGEHYAQQVLVPKLKRVDALTSLAAKATCQLRAKLRLRCAKLRAKVRNCVNDLHCKAAHALTRNFDTIFLPPFESQDMVAKKGGSRAIASAVARQMLCLAHYRFRMRLQNTCLTTDRVLVLTPEAFTTKTCTRCGVMNDRVGSATIFACSSCGLRGDRDVCGARNIGLKAVSLLQ
jgi:putative transposase